MRMKLFFASMTLLICMGWPIFSTAQNAGVKSAAAIYQDLQQLKVLGSVLYIAAHPDDENTRLLAWLAKEKKYRTGYLSLTRGDGGQNLIGDEQGVDLGLIRTQELLAARRMDGAEQFFSRAFDFGFTKTTQEALDTWNHDKILQDVVWVIRKFKPDVIITRFPPDERAGHGHHSASAVLAHEAFLAAADPQQFSEQFNRGVGPWKATRILWNTFNFGSANTTSKDQFKVEVGDYNAVLGKSYGEIAAESRSQHKSQGFGVPSSRGQQTEFFTLVNGVPLHSELFDGITTNWNRIEGAASIDALIDEALLHYDLRSPARSIPALLQIRKAILSIHDAYWKQLKLKEVESLILSAAGLFLEASTKQELWVQSDFADVTLSLNNRAGFPTQLKSFSIGNFIDTICMVNLPQNKNWEYKSTVHLPADLKISQPYWLEEKMQKGSFNIADNNMIGMPEAEAPIQARFTLQIGDQEIVYAKPVLYKYTDPVKGELFQPLTIVPAAVLSTDPGILIFKNQVPETKTWTVKVKAHKDLNFPNAWVTARFHSNALMQRDSSFKLNKGGERVFDFKISNQKLIKNLQDPAQAFLSLSNEKDTQQVYLNLAGIRYDHIPPINYFYADAAKILQLDLKTVGKRIGYIEGAGDKIPAALEQMGYEVILLKEKDLTLSYLHTLDAIITGVRAYNINDFMAEKYEVLMDYVKEGGNLISQYNTNNLISTLKSKMGPYPFTISRNRVTDETAPVEFNLPTHQVLNYPNKITADDFQQWIQERSIYNAIELDSHYQTPLTMADPKEPTQNGSLIIANYGKGTFVYTGLVFFRELPAGVPGAYRLLANIIALNSHKKN